MRFWWLWSSPPSSSTPYTQLICRVRIHGTIKLSTCCTQSSLQVRPRKPEHEMSPFTDWLILYLSFRIHQGAFVYGFHDHNDKSAHLPSVCHSAHVSRNEVSDTSSDSSYERLSSLSLLFCHVPNVCLHQAIQEGSNGRHHVSTSHS